MPGVHDWASGLVDGADFLDASAVDAVFEYFISVPGFPRRVVDREAASAFPVAWRPPPP
ncbi:hypothetical protein [Streptomyces sp. uw30]|uniref:hypothetical protein n=1 Tax=Streptomyces sp. uw30 TaxID=1828179 RepID=UPI0016518ABD|nr:hypothetical protein [Streptomyces sp. uw30]